MFSFQYFSIINITSFRLCTIYLMKHYAVLMFEVDDSEDKCVAGVLLMDWICYLSNHSCRRKTSVRQNVWGWRQFKSRPFMVKSRNNCMWQRSIQLVSSSCRALNSNRFSCALIRFTWQWLTVVTQLPFLWYSCHNTHVSHKKNLTYHKPHCQRKIPWAP